MTLMTHTEKERWERFVQFTDELRLLCERHHAAILHTPVDILVKFQEGDVVYDAGTILCITPGRTMCAHAKEGR